MFKYRRIENLNHLYCFYVVMSSRNQTEAAERLGTTQPVVSATITRFEKQLGIKLFEVHGRRHTPTPRAVIMHGYCKDIFHLTSVLEKKLFA
jgi:DNA-binding transcriptional LysR family regulator